MENFDIKKLKEGLLNIKDKVLWTKEILGFINIRKLVIYGLIVLGIYGWGVYKGRLSKPVQINLDFEKEFTIKIDGYNLHKPPNSKQLEIVDLNGKKIRDVVTGDVKEIQKKLKPYGFQLKYFATAGAGIGNEIKKEGGLGLDFLKYYKFNGNIWATNEGIYIGPGYKITDNFDIISGIGKGYKEKDTRIYLGGKWRF